MKNQLNINEVEYRNWDFPTTRYSGSKRRLLFELWQVFNGLNFDSALDAFSGTASVSYLLKRMGKSIISNDQMHSNYWTSMAIIENDDILLSPEDVNFIISKPKGDRIWNFISSNFKDYYFTDQENVWLDECRYNIEKLSDLYKANIYKYKKAIALHALFQSALRKRPFNMFHRRNLYLRLASVNRNFGNMTTWSTEFNIHFNKFIKETNSIIFSNGNKNQAYKEDALMWENPPESELIYLDPPYVWPGASRAEVSYLIKYHFLEGIARYDEWPKIIDNESPILQIKNGYIQWPGANPSDRKELNRNFEILVEKYHNRIIVLSYREPGIPSIREICKIMSNYKKKIFVAKWPYSYALRKTSKQVDDMTNEVIIVGVDGDYSGPGEIVK